LGLFDRLFQKEKKEVGPTDIRFGRYSDAYKETEQYDLWDQSLTLFEQKAYLDAYERFLQYLNDPSEENVEYERSDNILRFEIIQGSMKLVGESDGNKIRVEAKVARVKAISESLFRHLIEYNYQLRYCRFGLTRDNHVAIIFDSSNIDGSPYKLYYALKEAASHADKSDDLLIHEYDNVEYTNHDLFKHISDDRKSVKYEYLIREIQSALKVINVDKGGDDGHSGGKAYTLLSLAYRLDYLIKPEGYLMDRLEEINSIYFSNEITDVGDKIQMISKVYQSIINHDREVLLSEMYWVKSTFGITTPVNHDRIVNFIDGELANMDWYIENEHPDITKCIPEYIIGYALFHFAPPKPDKDLLELYWRTMEQNYFSRLGFSRSYKLPNGKFDKKAIKKAIKEIVQNNQDRYPNLDPNVERLRFGTTLAFAISYLRMIQQLDMTSRG